MKNLLICLLLSLFAVTSCQDASSSISTKMSDTREDCCKICVKGKACGDTCIKKTYNCYKPKGCACNGY